MSLQISNLLQMQNIEFKLFLVLPGTPWNCLKGPTLRPDTNKPLGLYIRHYEATVCVALNVLFRNSP